MNPLTKHLAEVHIADMHREATRQRVGAAVRPVAREAPTTQVLAVTLRLATSADAPALVRLATLDSSEVPAAPVMLAEVGGELRAALSLIDRTAIADPFHPASQLVQLRVTRSEQLDSNRSNRLARLHVVGLLLAAIRNPHGRGAASSCLALRPESRAVDGAGSERTAPWHESARGSAGAKAPATTQRARTEVLS